MHTVGFYQRFVPLTVVQFSSISISLDVILDQIWKFSLVYGNIRQKLFNLD